MGHDVSSGYTGIPRHGAASLRLAHSRDRCVASRPDVFACDVESNVIGFAVMTSGFVVDVPSAEAIQS